MQQHSLDLESYQRLDIKYNYKGLELYQNYCKILIIYVCTFFDKKMLLQGIFNICFAIQIDVKFILGGKCQ